MDGEKKKGTRSPVVGPTVPTGVPLAFPTWSFVVSVPSLLTVVVVCHESSCVCKALLSPFSLDSTSSSPWPLPSSSSSSSPSDRDHHHVSRQQPRPSLRQPHRLVPHQPRQKGLFLRPDQSQRPVRPLQAPTRPAPSLAALLLPAPRTRRPPCQMQSRPRGRVCGLGPSSFRQARRLPRRQMGNGCRGADLGRPGDRRARLGSRDHVEALCDSR